jgi:integrase
MGMTATVHQLRSNAVTLANAVDAYLATLGGAEQAATRRQYAKILGHMIGHFGPDTDLAAVDADSFAAWFRARWQDKAPSTWNTSLAAVKGAVGYWRAQSWAADDVTRVLVRRRPRPDRSRALDRADVDRLLADDRHSLRDRLLWTMLYETAARSAEVLSLNVEDLNLAAHQAKVVRKGGATDTIVWQTGTARLLPRLLKGRKSGPLFVTERRARVQLAASDLDADGHARLSYEQASQTFKKASGGATLHQLRHSALTHDAERGTSTPMLMARSGHTSVRSLAKYARVSVEALARHQAESDPASRRYHH